MHFLSTADAKFLLGAGPTIISAVPMIRRQGNGHFTGFVRTTYSDGSKGYAEFIVNARSAEEARAAYATSGMA